MPFNFKRLGTTSTLAGALAMSAFGAVAVADVLVADADVLVDSVQSSRDLGTVDPGATRTAQVSFQLRCDGTKHADANQRVDIAQSSVSAPTGGSVTGTATTIGSVPATWPDDGQHCPTTLPAPLEDNGNSTVTIVAPKAPGDYTYQVAWGTALAPVGGQDSASITGSAKSTFTLKVPNTPPVVTAFTGADAAKVGETKNYAFTATDANDTTPTKSLEVTGPNGAALGSGAVSVNNAELKVTYNTTGTFEVTAVASDGVNTSTKSAPITVTVSPADSTPPVITADVQGPQGDSGWYTDDATVSFRVVDAESTVSSQSSGCATSTVSSDTSGTTFTCTATSAGGTATESVTVKRDATHPVISRRAAGDSCDNLGNNGWCRGEQTAGFSASDATSGLVNAAGSALASPYAFTKSTTANGGAVQIPSGTIKDAAGNTATAIDAGPFKIDSVDPVINGGASPAANAATWNNTAVNVTFRCPADTGSPIVSCGPNDTLSGEGRNQSVTGNAQDEAGNRASHTVSGINIDLTAPSAPTASFDKAAAYTDGAGAQWFKDSVQVSFGGSTDPQLADGGAGSGVGGYSAPITGNTSGTLAYSGKATDTAENASAETTGSVKVDATNPSLGLTGCPTADVNVGTPATLTVAAGDAESGLKTDPSGQLALDTTSVGTKNRSVTAEDNVGHSITKTCSYRVVYDWTGFFQPIDMSGFNKAKAGSTIPVKFSLGGDQGLSILASQPSSVQVACPSSSTPVDEIEEYTTATSGLKYDAVANQYIYNWKTDGAWAGKCRQLIVKLADGTAARTAQFTFTK